MSDYTAFGIHPEDSDEEDEAGNADEDLLTSDEDVFVKPRDLPEGGASLAIEPPGPQRADNPSWPHSCREPEGGSWCAEVTRGCEGCCIYNYPFRTAVCIRLRPRRAARKQQTIAEVTEVPLPVQGFRKYLRVPAGGEIGFKIRRVKILASLSILRRGYVQTCGQ